MGSRPYLHAVFFFATYFEEECFLSVTVGGFTANDVDVAAKAKTTRIAVINSFFMLLPFV